VPQFAEPEPPRIDNQPETASQPAATEDPSPDAVATRERTRASLAQRLGFKAQRPETPDDTRTGTSSPASGSRPKVGAAEASIAVGGLIVAVAGAVAWFVQSRSGHRATFRRPSGQEVDDIAAPVARIATRHVPAALFVPDLVDAISALSAAGAYATAGPIIIPNAAQPADQQEADE